MRKAVSIATIPFLPPIILFIHASSLDGKIVMSVPPIILAVVIPLIVIYLYTRRGGNREMREELRARRMIMITLGLAIMSLYELYDRLGLDTLARASLIYGLGTFLAGLFTILGHKTSVHVMARSVSGFIELTIRPVLGIIMILVSVISGVSRIKTGAHTVSQVITGFLIGPLSVAILFIR